jgi:hypothetical protein
LSGFQDSAQLSRLIGHHLATIWSDAKGLRHFFRLGHARHLH